MTDLLGMLARAQDIHDTVIKNGRAFIGLNVWIHISSSLDSNSTLR